MGRGWGGRRLVATVVVLSAATLPAAPTVAAAEGSVSQVADATFGSSDATQFPNARRVAVTAAGRTLVTHGKQGLPASE